MTERTFSIRAGLAASTVTPGSTAPDASLTTPAMLPDSDCAHATDGRNTTQNTTTTRRARDRKVITCPPSALAKPRLTPTYGDGLGSHLRQYDQVPLRE